MIKSKQQTILELYVFYVVLLFIVPKEDRINLNLWLIGIIITFGVLELIQMNPKNKD